jgi:hypothetical protein
LPITWQGLRSIPLAVALVLHIYLLPAINRNTYLLRFAALNRREPGSQKNVAFQAYRCYSLLKTKDYCFIKVTDRNHGFIKMETPEVDR